MGNPPANLLTEWAHLLMTSLADAGVEHLVLSPGSRLTPFVAASVGVERFRIHDAIDERAASFLALGIARATDTPAALLCTSGTAGAHYFPAVIEASLAHVPLVVITADRPPMHQNCGTPQTIDQLKLFGSYVRDFADLGLPQQSRTDLMALRRTVARMVSASRYPLPGAVHINAPAHKPLEPAEPDDDNGREYRARVRSILSSPIARASVPTSLPPRDALVQIANACAGAKRGLILCGPTPRTEDGLRESLFELARATGFPVLAEATSQMRLLDAPPGVVVCDPFDVVLRGPTFRKAPLPDLVVQIGGTPTSSAWEHYPSFDPGEMRHVVIARHGWTDPHGGVSDLLFGDPKATLEALTKLLPKAPSDPSRAEWTRGFERAAARAEAVVDEELAKEPVFGEGSAVRALMGAMPAGAILLVGNSMPVRHLDIYAKRSSKDIRVICQRGANGIDGLVAGAAGTSRALQRPTVLLIGDVSFLHDLTSLSLAAEAKQPLVVVVLNNRGGRIFEHLPLAKASGVGPLGGVVTETLKHIITRHELDFQSAASLFRVAYDKVDSLERLKSALGEAFARNGATLVEVTVTEHGASEQLRRIVARVEEQIAR